MALPGLVSADRPSSRQYESVGKELILSGQNDKMFFCDYHIVYFFGQDNGSAGVWVGSWGGQSRGKQRCKWEKGEHALATSKQLRSLWSIMAG